MITLKLKRANHSSLSRRVSLHEPTQIADRLYREARALYDRVNEVGPYRLLGVGLSDLTPAEPDDFHRDLLDPQATARAEAERATDAVRARFGKDAILKGRSLR